MLNERDVAFAKTKMDQILRGKMQCPADVRRRAGLILRALDRAMHGDFSCDWLSSRIHHPRFREDLMKKLSPVAGGELFRVGLIPMNSKEKELLDHHYWNDCAPWWDSASFGRYGASPGEDILIKLIAGKC